MRSAVWSNCSSPVRTGSLITLFALFAAFATAGCGADGSDGGSPVVVDDSDADTTTDTGGDDPGGGDETDAGTTDDTGESDGSGAGGDDTSSPSPEPDTGGSTDEDAGSEPDDSPSDCSTTEEYCDGTCTEVLSNPDHCGSCGFACSDGASCVNGICQCADGNIRCDGRCVDPTSNDDHCFRCGNACPDGEMCQKSVCVEKNIKQAAIDMINQIRQTETDCGQYGIRPAGPTMTTNEELEKAAFNYAKRMADKDFFAHEDPYDGSDFVERVNRTDYRGTVLGENLSRGLRQSAERMVGGWKSSDDHCKVMTNPNANEMGLGRYEPNESKFDAYWVLLVGRQ